jgi:hypothetical protein
VVETSPNAEVYLDDRYTGRASPEGRLVIGHPEPGEHNLRVSLAGKRDSQRKITVVGGEEVKIAATLADVPGSILLRTTPGAEVSLDNSSRGVADASGQLAVSEVAPGVHALRIAARGKEDFSQTALRYHAGTSLVLLDPDLRKAFRSERAVNDALRLVIELCKVGSYKRRGYGWNGT